ncbi:MAG: tRNA glutamyl-Q(34) synthetase GluQRS [Phycisphaerae bacterium]|nr:tRNA glutamyl-Q(34) synthetase GluQRS [Phycisphaerae bacterium]
MNMQASRLAPSPTGALHLGNARTFLVNWAIARKNGWTLCMRMEDLDGPRVKQGAVDECLQTLQWLGLDWDGPMLVQSNDQGPYLEAMEQLCSSGRVYPCDLSRSDIASVASAPQEGVHETPFPASLRPPTAGTPIPFDPAGENFRFMVEPGIREIDDHLLGSSRHDVHAVPGDFVVWTRRNAPAYQLAVVIDDARQGVTQVVRGEDLLPSAARQTLLYEALGLQPPEWWHLPLVLGEDGHRLAKRHGDTRVSSYRAHGIRPERIIGLLGHWCGLTTEPEEMTIEDFREGFEIDLLPSTPITMGREDDQWLRSG